MIKKSITNVYGDEIIFELLVSNISFLLRSSLSRVKFLIYNYSSIVYSVFNYLLFNYLFVLFYLIIYQIAFYMFRMTLHLYIVIFNNTNK